MRRITALRHSRVSPIPGGGTYASRQPGLGLPEEGSQVSSTAAPAAADALGVEPSSPLGIITSWSGSTDVSAASSTPSPLLPAPPVTFASSPSPLRVAPSAFREEISQSSKVLWKSTPVTTGGRASRRSVCCLSNNGRAVVSTCPGIELFQGFSCIAAGKPPPGGRGEKGGGP